MNLLSKISLLLLAIALGSCAAVYVPNVVNAPLLSESGDIQVTAAGGLNGYDAQGACAITNHIGIMVNGSFAHRTSDSSDNFHRHAFLEAGAGYYLPVAEVLRFEVFGGGGLGSVAGISRSNVDSNLLFSNRDEVSGNYYRLFLQPTFGVKTDVIDAAISMRTAYFNAYDLRHNDMRNTAMTAVVVEPAFTLRGGYKHVMAHTQLGTSLPIISDADFRWRPFILNVGITVRFNVKSKP